MRKTIFPYIMVLLLTITALLPLAHVHAETQRAVKNQTELKEALNDESVNSIVLADDINTTEKITITRPVTIDGNNHTIKYVGTFKDGYDNTVWDGIYVLQVYRTSATIKNIKLTGANAALLANGSTVNLEGTIDVSGNGFGGIELGQGKGVNETVKLNLADNIDIVNTTESANSPTLWVPEDSDPAVVEMNGVAKTIASGDEMALNEVEALFESAPTENPQTGEEIDKYILTGLIGLLSFTTVIITTVNKTKKA